LGQGILGLGLKEARVPGEQREATVLRCISRLGHRVLQLTLFEQT
jgi:hypothetical protein